MAGASPATPGLSGDGGTPNVDGGRSTSDAADAALSSDTSTTSSDADASSCVLASESSLAGVSIRFVTTTCTFTLAEAKAGIKIDYDVVIDNDVTEVVPQGQSSSPTIGPSGLSVFELLTGNAQRYCLCDEGLGAGLPNTPTTLKKGTYRGTFDWDGHNWEGPSDTGNPKGALFPAGDYRLDVSAIGKKSGVAFKVSSSFAVKLVP